MNANITNTDQITADLRALANDGKIHHAKVKRLQRAGLVNADGNISAAGWERLDATKPKRTRKPADLNACHCGCGETTASLFRQGHDARFAGVVGRRVAETAPATADTPWLDAEVSRHMAGCSDALIRKAIRVAVNHRAKLAKRTS